MCSRTTKISFVNSMRRARADIVELGDSTRSARVASILWMVPLVVWLILWAPFRRWARRQHDSSMKALDVGIRSIWAAEGAQAGVEALRDVFRRLSGIVHRPSSTFGALAAIYRSFRLTRIQPYGRFIPALAHHAVVEWLFACERQCGNWQQIIDLAEQQLADSSHTRDMRSAWPAIRTWAVRKAEALGESGRQQEAKECLFSYIEIVKDDPVAKEILKT